MKNVTRRSNAARRSGESLHFRSSPEHRNPDPRGEDVPVSGPDGNPVSADFVQIVEPSAGRVGPPDPGIDYHSLGYSGLPYNTKDGSTFAWLPEAEFARVAELDKGLVGLPGPGILRRVFDPGGILVFDQGGVQYFGDSYDLGLGLCLRSRSGSSI